MPVSIIAVWMQEETHDPHPHVLVQIFWSISNSWHFGNVIMIPLMKKWLLKGELLTTVVLF